MNKCLVTKLNGTIQGDDLFCLGEMRVKINSIDSPDSKSQGFAFITSQKCVLKTIGDSFFTDSTLVQNLGKTMEIPANTETGVYVSNNDGYLCIMNKYSLQKMQLDPIYNVEDVRHENRIVDIEQLKFSNGLTSLNLINSNSFGDLDYIKGLTNLSDISVYNSKITGNLSSLKNLTKLVKIELGEVYGDINNLSQLSNLGYIFFNKGNQYGDLALLPANVTNIECIGSFSWSKRAASAKTFSIKGNVEMTDIDNMLKDQAACVKSSSGVIQVIGTRTSASDDAVQTLQSNGYTVSVTPKS